MLDIIADTGEDNFVGHDIHVTTNNCQIGWALTCLDCLKEVVIAVSLVQGVHGCLKVNS